MRLYGNTLPIAFALPVFVVGVLLIGLVAKAAMGKPESTHDDGSQVVLVQLEVEEDQGSGFGYVEAVPEDQATPPTPEEKEAEMNRAALAARLGGGWENGGMLAEDLDLLVAVARSQLAMYEDNFRALTRGTESAEIQAAREGHARALDHLRQFEAAGQALRGAMVELRESLDRIEPAEATSR